MLKKIVFIIIFTSFILHITFNNDLNAQQKLYFGNNELYKEPNQAYNPYILESKYDYSNVARTITKECKNDYEKICAIYEWICDNISYDTDYKIHDADQCWDKRKGVCQAYCNLFYHIAKSIDLKVEIIGGKAKNENTCNGHSWIFAYTQKNHGILLDPTWGAGYVNGNEFSKNYDCWTWFNVSPQWMILSHLPEDNSYQFIDNPISFSKFISLPPVNSLLISYGMYDNNIYDMAMNDKLSLPTLYSGGEGKLQLIDFPLQESLNIGENYTLRVKMLSGNDIAIINQNTLIDKEKWNHEGNNIYSIEFTPNNTGAVSFSIHDNGNTWSTILQYNIDDTTNNDKNNILDKHSLCKIENINTEEWEKAGISKHKLQELIESHNVKELPITYSDMGEALKIISIPMTRKLNKGQSYTFSFIPTTNSTWAIINNDIWYQEWNIGKDGSYTMTITPEQEGELIIYVKPDLNQNNYYSCIGFYVIE